LNTVNSTVLVTTSPTFQASVTVRGIDSHSSDRSLLPIVIAVIGSACLCCLALIAFIHRRKKAQADGGIIFGASDLRDWIQEDGGGEVRVARWVSVRFSDDFFFGPEDLLPESGSENSNGSFSKDFSPRTRENTVNMNDRTNSFDATETKYYEGC
jgi:hypothetical protein